MNTREKRKLCGEIDAVILKAQSLKSAINLELDERETEERAIDLLDEMGSLTNLLEKRTT